MFFINLPGSPGKRIAWLAIQISPWPQDTPNCLRRQGAGRGRFSDTKGSSNVRTHDCNFLAVSLNASQRAVEKSRLGARAILNCELKKCSGQRPLGAARKASSASPIHHSPFTIHNSAPYSSPAFCLSSPRRRKRNMNGDYTLHCTCTSRRVSEKRDSAMQGRKFLFF
jgi:hypothetical protein